MNLLTKKKIKELSACRQANSVSIFIPTHRYGEETTEGKDVLQLKNQLKHVHRRLEESGIHSYDVEEYLKPATDLLKMTTFWRNQSDGLAIFINRDIFEKFELPVHFEPFYYVSDEFYLVPLMPFFEENGQFYLLHLSIIGRLKFFKCNKHDIIEIDLSEQMPEKLEDVVGYDHEQKTLQFRTQQGNLGQGQFHGHLDEKNTKKNEFLRYFRAVNDTLFNFLESQHDAPLVVACSDNYFGIYKEANTYQQLYPENVPVKLDDNDISILHQKAWETIQPFFSVRKKEKFDRFRALQGTGKTSRDIHQIVPAADNGKIDTLFIKNNADIFGKYDYKNQDVSLEGHQENGSRSLLNLAATRVMVQGGNVFLMEQDEMPNDISKVNALYRY